MNRCHDTARFKYKGPKMVRDEEWWVSTWRDKSNWCSETFGCNNWEFLEMRFSFCQPEHLTMYLLRWT
jgi:hypothetical protein